MTTLYVDAELSLGKAAAMEAQKLGTLTLAAMFVASLADTFSISKDRIDVTALSTSTTEPSLRFTVGPGQGLASIALMHQLYKGHENHDALQQTAFGNLCGPLGTARTLSMDNAVTGLTAPRPLDASPDRPGHWMHFLLRVETHRLSAEQLEAILSMRAKGGAGWASELLGQDLGGGATVNFFQNEVPAKRAVVVDSSGRVVKGAKPLASFGALQLDSSTGKEQHDKDAVESTFSEEQTPQVSGDSDDEDDNTSLAVIITVGVIGVLLAGAAFWAFNRRQAAHKVAVSAGEKRPSGVVQGGGVVQGTPQYRRSSSEDLSGAHSVPHHAQSWQESRRATTPQPLPRGRTSAFDGTRSTPASQFSVNGDRPPKQFMTSESQQERYARRQTWGPAPPPSGGEKYKQVPQEKPTEGVPFWLGPERFKDEASACEAISGWMKQRQHLLATEQKQKEVRQLLAQWHPDKNAKQQELSTKVFQFIQSKKDWYLNSTTTTAS